MALIGRLLALMLVAVLATSATAVERFSINEEVIIERNQALRQIRDVDPRLVRRVLNAMSFKAPRDKQRDLAPKDRAPSETNIAPSPGEQVLLDPAENPDLVI